MSKTDLAKIVKTKDIIPEINGTKMSLVPAVVTNKQIKQIFVRTPQEHIFTRPGKGGGTFEYVTGVYIKKCLNYIFGFNWDFEIINEEEKYSQIVVQGKLTVHDNKGKSICKMQYGRADIKMKKGSRTPMDYGNDKKAAATDCLKKCASEFGIASDIYGKNEFRDLGAVIQDNGKKVATPAKNSTQPSPAPRNGTKTVHSPDYSAKLAVEVMKQTKNLDMKGKDICEYLTKKLGRKITDLQGAKKCQMLLAELLVKN